MVAKIAVPFADDFYQRHRGSRSLELSNSRTRRTNTTSSRARLELEKLDAHTDRNRSSAAGSSHNYSAMPSPIEEGEGRAQMNSMRYLTKIIQREPILIAYGRLIILMSVLPRL